MLTKISRFNDENTISHVILSKGETTYARVQPTLAKVVTLTLYDTKHANQNRRRKKEEMRSTMSTMSTSKLSMPSMPIR